jgi:hypothetical protein
VGNPRLTRPIYIQEKAMSRLLLILLVQALISLAPSAGIAQQGEPGRQGRRIPVTIVLVERLAAPGAPFLVQRRAATAPHDVILLRTDADASQLSEAVRTLLVARQAGGDVPATSGTLRMRPQTSGGGARPVLPWAARVLTDLQRAEPQRVEGIGTVKSVQIYLPPQNPRRTDR